MTTGHLGELEAATASPRGIELPDASPAGLVESTPVESGIDRRNEVVPTAPEAATEPTDGPAVEKLVVNTALESDAAIDAVPTSAVTVPEKREGKPRGKKGVTGFIDAEVTSASSTDDSPTSSDAADPVKESQVEGETGEPQEMGSLVAADSTPGTSASGNPAATSDVAIVPQLSQQALGSLLDDSTAELVALEAFGCEVDDRARENEWVGRHTEISLAVFQAELAKTGECTFNVDENGVLLDDPVKFRSAPETNAQITLRVHQGLSDAQKSNFILLTQGRDRTRTHAENRELKHKIILAGLVQGLNREKIAEMAGVHANTVRNVEKRVVADPNSKLGIPQRPDGRFSPETLAKIAEATELRKAGMGNAEIAAMFDTDVETVGKWLKDPAEHANKKAKSSAGKKAKANRDTAPAQSAQQPIEDIAASDGIPELHRQALERLGWSQEKYAQLDGDSRDDARETITQVDNDDASLLYYAKCGKHLLAFAEELLEQRCRSVEAENRKDKAPPGDLSPDRAVDVVGEILVDTATDSEPDSVVVSLPTDAGSVIAEGDTGIARLALPEDGEDARVRVNGFDSGTAPADRETMPQDNRTKALEPDLDYRSSPYEKHFGRKRGGDK